MNQDVTREAIKDFLKPRRRESITRRNRKDGENGSRISPGGIAYRFFPLTPTHTPRRYYLHVKAAAFGLAKSTSMQDRMSDSGDVWCVEAENLNTTTLATVSQPWSINHTRRKKEEMAKLREDIYQLLESHRWQPVMDRLFRNLLEQRVTSEVPATWLGQVEKVKRLSTSSNCALGSVARTK